MGDRKITHSLLKYVGKRMKNSTFYSNRILIFAVYTRIAAPLWGIAQNKVVITLTFTAKEA